MLDGRLLLQRVLGDVDVDRAGPARAREVERLGDDTRDVVGVADQVVVLRHRQGDAGDVDLLERVLADERARDVAGDRDHRHGVELGGRDRGDEVRRAGSARAHAHADAAARPRVAVRGVPAALLVADQDVPDLGVVAEDVVDRQDDAARVAEQDVRPLADERLHERVGPDARPLPRPDVPEHVLARLLDRRRGRRPVGGHVAAPRGRGGRAARRWLALRHRHPLVSLSVRQAPRPPEHAKTLAARRGSLRSSVAGASAALVPPRSSVLPPGAGNEEAKKAVKPGKERAKQVEKGYVPGGQVAQGDGHAAAIGRHDDGDGAVVAILEEAQATRLPVARLWRVRAV